MCNYHSETKLAKYFLAHHMPHKALAKMVKAITECPSCNGKDFASLLFYLGIIVKKLGHPNIAIKFWISSYRIKKNKYSKEMIKRFSNGYGLKKEENAELDDKKAFFSIHLLRYLDKKRTRHFSTQAEVDMITDLLEERWEKMLKSGIISNKSIDEKQKIFKDIIIVFPFMFVNKVFGDSVININFSDDTKVMCEKRCVCGSGLPSYMCCGRAPSIEEIANGFF